MPTADLHGSTIQIDTGKGEKTTFELVRVGTLKEFETVKGALAKANGEISTRGQAIAHLHSKIEKAEEARANADAAYREEKDASAILRQELGYVRTALQQSEAGAVEGNEKLANLEAAFEAEESVSAQLTVERDRYATERDGVRETNLVLHQKVDDTSVNLAAATSQLDARRDENAALTKALDAVNAELAAANGDKGALATSCDNFKRALLEARAETAAKQTEIGELRAEVGCKDAELENLMTVKASLEETETALEAKDKELCENQESHRVTMANHDRYRKERDDIKAAFESLTDRHARCETALITADRGRNASNATLAALKAELLAEGDRFKTILDVMAEKISGE